MLQSETYKQFVFFFNLIFLCVPGLEPLAVTSTIHLMDLRKQKLAFLSLNELIKKRGKMPKINCLSFSNLHINLSLFCCMFASLRMIHAHYT